MYEGLNACKGVFNPNVPIFQSNCIKGLHFSAFHYYFSYCTVAISGFGGLIGSSVPYKLSCLLTLGAHV